MANPEQSKFLIQSMEEGNHFRSWNRWRKKNPGEKIDLFGVDLSFRDLSGANLSWAELENADLTGAICRKTNFEGSRLDGANFLGANLKQACLKSAMLHKANLGAACIEGADLRTPHLTETNIRGVNFQMAIFNDLGDMELDPLCQGVEFPCTRGISLVSKAPCAHIFYGVISCFLFGIALYYFSLVAESMKLWLFGVFSLSIAGFRFTPFLWAWCDRTSTDFAVVFFANLLSMYLFLKGEFFYLVAGVIILILMVLFLFRRPQKWLKSLEGNDKITAIERLNASFLDKAVLLGQTQEHLMPLRVTDKITPIELLSDSAMDEPAGYYYFTLFGSFFLSASLLFNLIVGTFDSLPQSCFAGVLLYFFVAIFLSQVCYFLNKNITDELLIWAGILIGLLIMYLLIKQGHFSAWFKTG